MGIGPSKGQYLFFRVDVLWGMSGAGEPMHPTPADQINPPNQDLINFLPDATEILLQDQRILDSTKTIAAAVGGRQLDVDSSLMLNSELIINVKKTLDDDSKNIHRKRATGSVKTALQESLEHLDGTLEEALGEIEKWVHQTEALELTPLPVETVDLVAKHAAEVMVGDQLNRRIHELESMIEELRRHVE